MKPDLMKKNPYAGILVVLSESLSHLGDFNE
jgi:hypothetical protein